MQPIASIVIRCYNEEEHIGRLLSGITEQTLADKVEIIVVDSGSTDATVSIASQFPTKIVSIDPEVFSFGRALNIGCAEASGEFIVAASAHVYPVYSDWLEHLLAPFEDPEVALSYGKQRGNEVTKYSEHQIFAKWFPETSDYDQNHPFCNNANAAIRRVLWEEMPYNEELTGLEDLDWAKRAMQRGYKIAYAADAPIIHVHDETPSDIFNRYRREAIALKRIMPRETFGLWDFVRLFASNAWNDSTEAWNDGVFGEKLSEILTFRLMQFWGAYKGFRQQGEVPSKLRRRFYYPNRDVGGESASSGSEETFSVDSQTERKNRQIDYSSVQREEIDSYV
ncbi:glycosyltransferase [Salinibacter ruber]|uniref:glycosyltransferase n=1 Tax=Salinibacter ruber TaxID=146919 RepID=UPI002169511A|nr:glycosyltransferase involved in cell wall biosynthesis [Salinibacter ruber]